VDEDSDGGMKSEMEYIVSEGEKVNCVLRKMCKV
jgi:hypothetical protein